MGGGEGLAGVGVDSLANGSLVARVIVESKSESDDDDDDDVWVRWFCKLAELADIASR